MAKSEPGLLLFYADINPILEHFDDATVGAVFRAVFSYAQYGEAPELPDMARGIFYLLASKVDADKAAYQEKTLKRSYAGYVSRQKAEGAKYISFADWMEWRETAEKRGIRFDDE